MNAPTQCAGCHIQQQPHDDFGACETCHTTTHEGGFAGSTFDPTSIGFTLEGQHITLGCRDGHGPDGALNKQPPSDNAPPGPRPDGA